MMASKPVAAKEGGMKDYADCQVFDAGFSGWVVVTKRLDHGSQAVMTHFSVWCALFRAWAVEHPMRFRPHTMMFH
jgi:hypothetical protein